MPDEWKQVGRVSRLFLYPVKSLHSVEVESFTAGRHAAESGHMVDRQFMLVDRKDKLVTARQFPHMTLVTVEVTATQLSLGYPGMQTITVNIPAKAEQDSAVGFASAGPDYEVFRESCKGLNMGAEVGSWLSEV